MIILDGDRVIITRDEPNDGCIADAHTRLHPHENTSMIACNCPKCTPQV